MIWLTENYKKSDSAIIGSDDVICADTVNKTNIGTPSILKRTI